jgi:hypothetical protein
MMTPAALGLEVMVAVGLGAVLTVLILLAVVVPMRCQGPIARPPYRGCRKTVYGLLGRCRYHGFQPGRRLMAAAGGGRLLLRRTCGGCGQPAVFVRMSDTGKPFLGCTEYPACKKIRFLDS